MNNNFSPNYIKCPGCRNILDLSFITRTCPNPFCGFDFNGTSTYLDKNDEKLRRMLFNAREDREGREYRLVKTAIRFNNGNFLAHFIECNWGAHYETLFKEFISIFFDDLIMLKKVLKSEVIKPGNNVITSKNGYKIFKELYDRLEKIHNFEINFFLRKEFPELAKEYREKEIESRRKKWAEERIKRELLKPDKQARLI